MSRTVTVNGNCANCGSYTVVGFVPLDTAPGELMMLCASCLILKYERGEIKGKDFEHAWRQVT